MTTSISQLATKRWLEAILLETVKAPNVRRARELALLAGALVRTFEAKQIHLCVPARQRPLPLRYPVLVSSPIPAWATTTATTLAGHH